MVSLTLSEHRTVLSYYGIDHTNMNAKDIRKQAEDVLAKKLCRCIKQVAEKDDNQPIAICRRNVVMQKGIDIYGFSCKNKPTLKIGKNGQRLHKTACNDKRKYVEGPSKGAKRTKSTKRTKGTRLIKC